MSLPANYVQAMQQQNSESLLMEELSMIKKVYPLIIGVLIKFGLILNRKASCL